ncbi:MAG: sigma-54-dependent transcriptional regulator [Thermodesulfobacteriota bacterium]
MARILVIDDDPVILDVISEILRTNNHEVAVAHNGESGIKKAQTDLFDLVLTDLVMPDLGGMEVLDHVSSMSPAIPCIILTGYGTIKNSVEAIKKGAFNYITKPITAVELLSAVDKALQFRDLEAENQRLRKELRYKYRYTNLIGTSKAIEKIYDMIDKVADTDSTVLISGPSGTGKELIARAIHYGSNRSNKPIVVINCGAIPEELLESELFGHEKGAFTGAYRSRIGRFEIANGGSIFLDEVGEMSPALQVKLLRVLQEQTFERVGGTRTIHVDVRIIAATNKNLTVAINNGSFREDLYYRLNVVPIRVASLKQRRSDIPLLIDHFLKKFQKGKTKKISGFSPEAMEAMLDYEWPGNVRELENVIKRITILSDNEVVSLDDLPEHIEQTAAFITPSPEDECLEDGRSLDEAVRDYEKRLIIEALEKSGWVKTKAAKLLNINRTTLVEKIKRQNLDREISTLAAK